jgi:hypothetical protein
VLKSELDAGDVPHALAVGWPKGSIGSGYVAPASSSDGGAGSGGLPMGTRLQLDPSLTDAQLKSMGISDYYLPVAHAMQKYGAYIADSTSWMTVYAQSWGDNGQISWPSGWNPSSSITSHLRAVAPPSAPAYDDRTVFGNPHK